MFKFQPLYKLIYKRPLPESKSTLKSKIMALFFGLLCLAVAFSAELLGNVLQASLTIFGAVGGPLLAVFTLGMFTKQANEKVKIKFIMSHIESHWILFEVDSK